jgi:hypothetical protein
MMGGSVLFALKDTLTSQDKPSQTKRPDPLDPKVVQEFVRMGHFDLEGVKKKLDEMPTLLNATTDWGAGDFETALGGASHMGRKDIASFLIKKGARMDIFTAAMLGHLEMVKMIGEMYPEALESKGPHGITLLMHAQKGGQEAQQVVEFLQSKGITK